MQMGLVADRSRCSGCRCCEVACSFFHTGAFGYAGSRIQVARDDRECVYIPLFCRHCEDPACATACPTAAIAKEGAGRVVIRAEECIGCGDCTRACPYAVPEVYEIPRMDAKKGVALICDLCEGDPQCVRFCANEALRYEPLEETRGLGAEGHMAEVRALLSRSPLSLREGRGRG